MKKIETNPSYIQKLKDQKRSVGLLQFTNRDEQNFSRWYSLTENLVIKSFGDKSNQIKQFQRVYTRIQSSNDIFVAGYHTKIKDAKEKFKDLLNVFISELELDFEEKPKFAATRKSTGISMKMTNTQTVNQTIDISVGIKNIIDQIRQTESDPKRVSEAEEKLGELETQMKSKSPVWSTVKDILIWLLNFGRDTFLAALPIILQKYNQQ